MTLLVRVSYQFIKRRFHYPPSIKTGANALLVLIFSGLLMGFVDNKNVEYHQLYFENIHNVELMYLTSLQAHL